MRSGRAIRACVLALSTLLVSGTAATAVAEELDPLLRLLVAKGYITQEEAEALQAESDALEESEAKATPPPPVTVPEPAPKKKNWTDRVDPSGDVRLRYEGFDKKGAYDGDHRSRFRLRFRAGARFTITDWMTAGFQLRSGDPLDPVSNNITFGDAFTLKDIRLGEVYLEVRPVRRFGLVAGKFDPKNWWTVSDFQWDDDVTVEGVMTNVGLVDGDGAFQGLDLVAYGYLLDESSTGPEATSFGGQLRSKFRMGEDNSLRFGVGYDRWNHPQMIADLTLDDDIAGNKVTNLLDADDELISDFEILNGFAEFKNKSSERWPISFELIYYKNLGAKGLGADNDTGYFGRAQVGDYKELGQVAVRYAYYDSEPDALFYVFTQSDTSRGSNVKAHRLDVRVGFYARSYFNVTWYNSKLAVGDDETLDRYQVDYIVKF
jgi:hypothetical protein